jgi:hypothetical protein
MTSNLSHPRKIGWHRRIAVGVAVAHSLDTSAMDETSSKGEKMLLWSEIGDDVGFYLLIPEVR